jgi:hypothetical protein
MTILERLDAASPYWTQWGYTTNNSIKIPMTNAQAFYWLLPISTNQLPARFDYQTLQ